MNNVHITEEQMNLDIEAIVNSRARNERLSWKRKKDKIEELVKQLEPIEHEILELITEKKNPLLRQIGELRAVMVKECIHPKDLLVHYGEYVQCKFCEAKLSIVEDKQHVDE